VQTLIARRCGVKLSIHAVGEYVARKPLKRAYECDEAPVRRWHSSEWYKLRRNALA
jgi:hypothetical protein